MIVTLVDATLPTIRTWPAVAKLRSFKAKVMMRLDDQILERHGIRLTNRTDKFPISYGLLCIATVLRDIGCEVNYLNESFLTASSQWKRTMEKCISRSDIIGITCTTPSYPNAVTTARMAKAVNRNAWVVMGGPHVSFDDVNALKDGVDIVVRGEGEATVKEVVDAFPNRSKLSAIKGISFLDGQNASRTEPRAPLDAGSIPAPAWDMLPKRLLENALPRVFTSRGCIYSCPYCAETGFWRSLRVREPAAVAEEIGKVANIFHTNFIPIADSIFGVDPGQAKSIAMSREVSHEIFFSCQTRFDTLTERKLTQLKALNFVGIFLGMESGSQQVLHGMRRPVIAGKAYQTLQIVNELFPYVYSSWIVGYPGETPGSIEQTRTLIDDLHTRNLITDSRPRIYVPYPGTEPFLNPSKFGIRIKTRDWQRFVRLGSLPVFELSTISAFDIWLGFLACYVTGLRHQARVVALEQELDDILASLSTDSYEVHDFDYRALV